MANGGKGLKAEGRERVRSSNSQDCRVVVGRAADNASEQLSVRQTEEDDRVCSSAIAKCKCKSSGEWLARDEARPGQAGRDPSPKGKEQCLRTKFLPQTRPLLLLASCTHKTLTHATHSLTHSLAHSYTRGGRLLCWFDLVDCADRKGKDNSHSCRKKTAVAKSDLMAVTPTKRDE